MSSEVETTQAASLDAVLGAVADDTRRAVLRSLAGADETWVATSALVDRVAERVGTEVASDAEHRRRVRTGLHHNHLPKLAACGLIVRDTETDRVRDATGDLSRDVLALVALADAPE